VKQNPLLCLRGILDVEANDLAFLKVEDMPECFELQTDRPWSSMELACRLEKVLTHYRGTISGSNARPR
jgi:hypothetical protein